MIKVVYQGHQQGDTETSGYLYTLEGIAGYLAEYNTTTTTRFRTTRVPPQVCDELVSTDCSPFVPELFTGRNRTRGSGQQVSHISRVWSGLEVWVGWGRVKSFSDLTCWAGSVTLMRPNQR